MKPQDAILDLLKERGPGRTICPSEAARRLDPENWRGLMDAVREAGSELAASGAIEICQGGSPVDPADARGPVRYRMKG
jgi:hypothetical protein